MSYDTGCGGILILLMKVTPGDYDESALMIRFSAAFKQAAWEIIQADKAKWKSDAMILGGVCWSNISKIICHDGSLSVRCTIAAFE